MAQNEDVKVYKCTNFGACSKADNGEDIKIPAIETLGGVPECPCCHQNTLEENVKKDFPLKLIGVIVAALLVLGGVGFGIYKIVNGGDSTPTAIKLAKSEITMKVGESIVITPTAEPEGTKATFIFKTRKSGKIVSVSQDGTITALKGGKTQVLVKCAENPELKTICKIEVVEKTDTAKPQPATVAIEKITLSNSSVDLKVGEKKLITCTLTPEKNDDEITKSSSNTAVAEISENGEIMARNAGTAVITYKAAKSGVTASVNVTVKKKKGGEPDGGYGRVKLGYGVYEGPKNKNGRPDGMGGQIRFSRSYTIDLKKASGETVEVYPGDVMVNVKMKDGRLIQGQLKRTDGSQRWIIIG